MGLNFINKLAMDMKDLAVTSWCNPVFTSTELCTPNQQKLYNREEISDANRR